MYCLERGTAQFAREQHELTFPGEEWPIPTASWIVYDDDTDKPVGFCTLQTLRNESGIFLSRCGVLPCARNAGLQRRMIHARIAWARRHGLESVITYTTYTNHQSIANLLRCGLRFYTPDYSWAGKGLHYFLRELP